MENLEDGSRDPDRFQDETGTLECLKCPICLCVPSYATAVEHKDCAHIFCAACVAALKSKDCPLCSFPMTSARSISKENLFVYRLIKSLKTRCDRAECAQVLDWGGLQRHMLFDCQYAEVACRLGCGARFLKKAEAEHAEGCPRREVKCECCGQEVSLGEKKAHLEEVCEKSQEKRFECRFKEFGCGEKPRRGEVEEHYREFTGRHLEMAMLGLGERVRRLERENAGLKERIGRLEEGRGRQSNREDLLHEEEEEKKSLDLLADGRGRPGRLVDLLTGEEEGFLEVPEVFQAEEEAEDEKPIVCVECGEKALYLCCNKAGAKSNYEDACLYFSCERHSFHNSVKCMEQGRVCAGADHNCKGNLGFCGLISLFGAKQK